MGSEPWLWAIGVYLLVGWWLGFSTDPFQPTRWWSHLLCMVGWLPLLVVCVALNWRDR